MEPGKIIYNKNGLIIREHPTLKYKNDPILNNDKVYTIQTINGKEVIYTFEDNLKLLEVVLKNKILKRAFDGYSQKVINMIIRLKKEKNTYVPYKNKTCLICGHTYLTLNLICPNCERKKELNKLVGR